MECAVVISNDSDLAEPMRIVHEELGTIIGLISPTFARAGIRVVSSSCMQIYGRLCGHSVIQRIAPP